MNKKLTLKAALPANRDFAGTIEAVDESGATVAGPFAVSARAGDGLAAQHGNESRATTLPFGDTPLGVYKVVGAVATGPQTKYRPDLYGTVGAIVLTAKSGDAALAEANGRFEILIHGGAPGVGGRLRATIGHMRMRDADLVRLLALARRGDLLTCSCVQAPGHGDHRLVEDDEAQEDGSLVLSQPVRARPTSRRAADLVALGEYTPAVEPSDVDYQFISQREGGQLRSGYVPDADTSKSGVTVATGFDIGQRSAAQLEAMGLPDELVEKLTPYAGLRGEDAQDYLEEHPLTITKEEAQAIDRVAFDQTISSVSRAYDENADSGTFEKLPAEAKTVLSSVAFQYGNLEARTPKFWSAVSDGRWQDAVDELRHFGDHYQSRHNAEADLLQKAIDRGALPKRPMRKA